MAKAKKATKKSAEPMTDEIDETRIEETNEETSVAPAAKSLPHRLRIKQAIEDGGATKENLIESMGITMASLATNLSYLRMMGHFPVMDKETKIYSFVTEEEWNARKTVTKKKVTVSKKTPYEILAMAEIKLAKVKKQQILADTRLASNPEDALTQLKAEKAGIEVSIAAIERENAIAPADAYTETIETSDVGALDDPDTLAEDALI